MSKQENEITYNYKQKNNKTSEIEIFHHKHLVSKITNNKTIEILTDNEYINKLRSKNMKEYILKSINKQLYYIDDTDEEDPKIVTIKAISKIFDIYIINLDKEDKENLIFKSLNSLLFIYSNFWYEHRKKIGLRMNKYFENNSDLENDLLVALMVKSDNNTVYQFINRNPNVQIKEEYLNNEDLNEFIYSTRENSCENEDTNLFDYYFDDIVSAINYYQKNITIL
jgi:hypothetical protein